MRRLTDMDIWAIREVWKAGAGVALADGVSVTTGFRVVIVGVVGRSGIHTIGWCAPGELGDLETSSVVIGGRLVTAI